MMSVEERLAALGLTLPEAPRPAGAYLPAVRTGDLIFVSGQVPLEEGQLKTKGRLGADLTLDQGREAARIAALNCLSVVKTMVDLSEVARVVKLTGYVACAPDFFKQPLVVNGASELLEEIFGEAGKHARAAIGVSALPMNSPVEIEMIVQIKT